MKQKLSILLLMVGIFFQTQAQQIRINFANNLLDSSINHYLIDTNHCGNTLTFCDDASGNANNAYQFDGLCGMQTDSFSMTNTAYNGFSTSFYMNKNFDSDSIQYGILHFYKGTFMIYALHDSMFITITDTANVDHTYGAPCNIPNNEWFCTVVTCTDYGDVNFYFNKVKYPAGTANFKSLRRACEPGFCYPLHISFDIWNNDFFKGKLDDIRVWNWPSDSVNVDEICTKAIIPSSIQQHVRLNGNVYPNPANNLLNIEMQEASLLSIYDMYGRLLVSQNIAQGMNRIDLQPFSTGNYLLLIKNSKGAFYTKVEKQ
ncbi:MAG: T9SS type A sorting domain-containing protein [Bacteroidetes bacterium]|nr:T9SS type A sorting domain-containing protein [Bacteroidota bacterium]